MRFIILALLLAGCSAVVLDDTLTTHEVYVLNVAMDNEYGALNLYSHAADDHGAPIFSGMVGAEKNNIILLKDIFDHYHLPVPKNMQAYDSYRDVRAACEAAIDIERGKGYSQLINEINNADIKEVFRKLEKVSEKQLAEFKRCSLGWK